MRRISCEWLLVVVHFFCFSGAEMCEPGTDVCQSTINAGNPPEPKQGRVLIQRRIQGKQWKLHDQSATHDLVENQRKTTIAEVTQSLVASRKAGHAMKYFKHWSKGFLSSRAPLRNTRASTPVLMEEREELLNTLMRALANQQGCSRKMLVAQNWTLLDHEETDGVDHLIFSKVNTVSQLQYIAKQMNRIIVADPPIECASELQSGGPKREAGGAIALLHPTDDEMVKDCKKLYERTAENLCHKKLQVQVLRADRQIIDGIEVNMDVEVMGPAGGTTRHSPSCFFELHPSDKDASLLESLEDPAETDPTEMEKKGMKATVQTFSDLCKADEEDGQNAFRGNRPSMGLLSRYKGYEHLDDELPRAKVAMRHDLPQDVDLRRQYPKCFQNGGKEVIRNQGSCGSCWAFAAASAMMNTLCTSSEHSPLNFASSTDRYEVSVQQLMSCDVYQGVVRKNGGCTGASLINAHRVWGLQGITRERDMPYECGYGSPENHWQNGGPCKTWPWGMGGWWDQGQCGKDSQTGWFHGGTFMISGESDMMTQLSKGYSLWIAMDVDDSFMFWNSGEVFTELPDRGLLPHAMTAIGYGVQKGQKYWLIQNSWGTSWAVNGVVKVKRGVNLGGIEEDPKYIRGWVKGASTPPMPECVDAKTVPGYSQQYSCNSFGSWQCPNMPQLRDSCPVLCGQCKWQGYATPVPTPPTPTPQPTEPEKYDCRCTGHLNQYICTHGHFVYVGYCAHWQDCDKRYTYPRTFKFGDWAKGCPNRNR